MIFSLHFNRVAMWVQFLRSGQRAALVINLSGDSCQEVARGLRNGVKRCEGREAGLNETERWVNSQDKMLPRVFMYSLKPVRFSICVKSDFSICRRVWVRFQFLEEITSVLRDYNDGPDMKAFCHGNGSTLFDKYLQPVRRRTSWQKYISAESTTNKFTKKQPRFNFF